MDENDRCWKYIFWYFAAAERNNKVDITSAEIWQIQKQDGIILLGVGLSLWEDNVMIVLIITTGQ